MIAQHAALARTLGRAARPAGRRARRARRGVRAVGRARLAGRAEGRARSRSPARIAQLAEFVEVAHRVGGVEAATALARKRSRQAVRSRRWRRSSCADADDDPRRPRLGRHLGRGDRRRAGARGHALAASGSTRRSLAIANFVDLKSPYTLGHSRAVAELAAAAGRAARAPGRARSRTLRRAGLVHDFGRLGVSNAIWDKRGPLGAGEWERVRMHPYLTERMLHAVGRARAARRDRRAASRAARRLRLPARALRRRDLAARRASSAPPTPTRRCASRARTAPQRTADEAAARAARRGAGRPPRRRRRRGGARRRRPSRAASPRGARRADRRARSRCCGCSPAGCRTRRSPRGS